MIMNYVVRIKKVEVNKLNTLLNYLNSENHKNHTKKNTVITELSNRENFQKITSGKLWKNAESYIKNGKGGQKLKRIGKSLTFNIPPQFEFNEEVAADLSRDISKGLKNLYNIYGYDLKEEEIYKVLHSQDNSHYHVITPYLDMEGKTLLYTNHKKFLGELKLMWNEIMINTYGIDLEQYQPLSQEEQELNKNRRYLEELKEYYFSEFDIEENYIKNQVLKIDRLLRMSNEDLDQEEKKIKTIENSLAKVIENHKTNKKGINKWMI